MDGNSCIWLELLAIKRREYADVLLRATSHRASNDGVILVNHLNEVTCEHVHTLDSHELFLRASFL